MKSKQKIRSKVADLLRAEESVKRSGEDATEEIAKRNALLWVLDDE